MTKIVVSTELAQLFGRTFETVELVDEHGNHLGYFNPPFSKEEIEEAKRRLVTATGGRTTAEVLERLEGLDAQWRGGPWFGCRPPRRSWPKSG